MTTPSLPLLDLDLVVRNINNLPSPPAVIVELLHSIDDDDMSLSSLANIIARDQALVVRLLRIANSSFYGMPGRVDSIPDAIAVLGLRAVRTLAAASALSDGFAKASAPGFELEIFWRHSIATALSARALAQHMELAEGGAFVAGLLHDIGSLMLACSFPEHTAAVARYQAAHGCFFHEAETAVLGMDHARIGGILGERWHFPPLICAAIANHHRPDEPEGGALACTVHLGNALAHALGLAGDPDEMVPCISRECWDRANLSRQDSERIFGKIEQEFETLSQVLLT